MVVIIPHPTEELKLIKFQKELVKLLNRDGKIYYVQQPLWIELPEEVSAHSKADLKNIGKSIEQIILFPPEYQNADVVIPVMIDKIKVLLPFLHFYKKNDSQSPEKNSLPQLPPCSVTGLKIFRIAISEQLSEKSKALTDSVWVKL